MAGDPPLEQVVTKTWEAGLHGAFGNGVRWNAGVFRAENHDDILFVAAPNQTQFGFFKNFGKTRREGFEARAERARGSAGRRSELHVARCDISRSLETVNGASNSTNSTAAAGARGFDGNIVVRPGDRIPLIPQHLFKAYADYRATAALSLGVNLIAVGLELRAGQREQPSPAGRCLLPRTRQVRRLRRASTSMRTTASSRGSPCSARSTISSTASTTPRRCSDRPDSPRNGNFIARPLPAVAGQFPIQHATFYAPGAPRTFWVGLRYQFDRSQ